MFNVMVENIEDGKININNYECARNDLDTQYTEGVLGYLNM